jgi:hypothetical protein
MFSIHCRKKPSDYLAGRILNHRFSAGCEHLVPDGGIDDDRPHDNSSIRYQLQLYRLR